MHVPELGVSVAQIPDHFLTCSVESVITLACIALLVLPLAVRNTKHGKKKHADLAAQVDGVSSGVLGRVLGGVGPSRHDTTRSTESDHVGGGDGSDRWTSSIVRRPGEESRTPGKGTDCDQENATVSDIRVSCPPHDGESSNGGKGEYCKVDTTAVRLVRYIGNGDGNETGANVRGHRVELSLGCCPAKILKNSGLHFVRTRSNARILCITYHEKRDTLNRDVDAEETECAEVVVDVHNGTLDVVKFDLLVLVRATLRSQSLRGNHPFTLVEEPAVIG